MSFILHPSAFILLLSGCNSMVECQLPKLKVAGSIPVTRSSFQTANLQERQYQFPSAAFFIASETTGRKNAVIPMAGTRTPRALHQAL